MGGKAYQYAADLGKATQRCVAARANEALHRFGSTPAGALTDGLGNPRELADQRRPRRQRVVTDNAGKQVPIGRDDVGSMGRRRWVGRMRHHIPRGRQRRAKFRLGGHAFVECGRRPGNVRIGARNQRSHVVLETFRPFVGLADMPGHFAREIAHGPLWRAELSDPGGEANDVDVHQLGGLLSYLARLADLSNQLAEGRRIRAAVEGNRAAHVEHFGKKPLADIAWTDWPSHRMQVR